MRLGPSSAEGKKAGTRGHLLHDFTEMEYAEKANRRDGEEASGCQGRGYGSEGERGVIA